jgi:acyl carrier protein
MMTYETFSGRLVRLLEIEATEPINPYTELFSDLGLDSLQGFEMLLIIESLAGVNMPPLEIPEIYTMQDAFTYYRSLA